MREFFNICEYLGVTPAAFFAPLDADASPYARLCEVLRVLPEVDIEKAAVFIGWLSGK